MQKGRCANVIGRGQGGLSTKIHTTADALGDPMSFHLTGGHEPDSKGADVLLASPSATIAIADKGYDSQEQVE